MPRVSLFMCLCAEFVFVFLFVFFVCPLECCCKLSFLFVSSTLESVIIKRQTLYAIVCFVVFVCFCSPQLYKRNNNGKTRQGKAKGNGKQKAVQPLSRVVAQ